MQITTSHQLDCQLFDKQNKNAMTAVEATFRGDKQSSLLLWSLLEVSEVAATIARVCRARSELFTLLVEEKTGEDKNPRMLQDFKTLADVLVQETVKHHICEKWPTLRSHILGEENNLFTNTKGQKIVVEIKQNVEETAKLLEQVLDGNMKAALILATAVHQKPQVEPSVRSDFVRLKNALDEQDIPLDDIGIWIDPIDCTWEYIAGRWDSSTSEDTSLLSLQQQNHHRYGLRCCTVLIGGFLRSSGTPIFASVSQPFATVNGGPTSTFFCARSVSNVPSLPVKFDIVVSSAEDSAVRERLATAFSVTEASGAGYKMLMVVLGWCEAYVLTRPSTFRWDTCAPHALLKSQGGEVREFGEDRCLRYDVSDKQAACNSRGLIAYRNEAVYHKVLHVLGVR